MFYQGAISSLVFPLQKCVLEHSAYCGGVDNRLFETHVSRVTIKML
jgi:hypothetical protein